MIYNGSKDSTAKLGNASTYDRGHKQRQMTIYHIDYPTWNVLWTDCIESIELGQFDRINEQSTPFNYFFIPSNNQRENAFISVSRRESWTNLG